jgi:hypothetical protein
MQHLSSKETSPSPAVGLWRIVGCLTPDQTRGFTREIKLLASATFPEESSVRPRWCVAEGVRQRHSEWCPDGRGEACGCSPRWEAKTWRHRQLELASIGRLRAPSRCTLGEAASLWVQLAREGQIRNRSGRRYKPSALRTIEADFRLYLVPSLGVKVMVGITRRDLQRLVGGWLAAGSSPSKVRSIVNAAGTLARP